MDNQSREDVDGFEMPGILREIEAVAGREAALSVMRAHGGITMHFPSPHNLASNPFSYRRNWLVKLVGTSVALRIVREILPSGGPAAIPRGGRLAILARRQFVLKNAAMMSTSKIARHLSVTERCVQRIKAKLKKEHT